MQQSEESLTKVQHVIRELYSGSNQNNPLKIKQAQEYLVEFQKSPHSIVSALELLTSNVILTELNANYYQGAEFIVLCGSNYLQVPSS